jgi:hypothetical protein
MDPFDLLPPELAVQVLLCLANNAWHRPDSLRAPLLVSKRWNAIAMEPELWIHGRILDYCRGSIDLQLAQLFLQRAQGGLRSLALRGTVFLSSLWDGAIQEASSLGVLARVTLDGPYTKLNDSSLNNLEASSDRVAQICKAVGTPSLRLFHIDASVSSPGAASLLMQITHGILERSLHLRDLRLDIEGDVGSAPWSTTIDEKGARPLHKLEKLTLSSLSPSLWEYLSGLGVKLTSVSLRSPDYDFGELERRDPSGIVRQHILDVISGPHLQHFTYDRNGGMPIHPSIQAAVLAHPRRSLVLNSVLTDPGIASDSLVQLEELELVRCLQGPSCSVLCQSLPRLRKLKLRYFSVDDAILARALRGVSETLEALDMCSWLHPAETSMDQTVSAIGTLRFLRSLKLEGCRGMTHAMLEPLLIGDPPSQLPLCARVRLATIRLQEKSPQFLARLLESMRKRSLYVCDNDIDGW